MGTDIHVAAEIRKADGWHLAEVDLPDERNYVSFAVLANVRNGFGFAGYDTGDTITPISLPRGLPEDMSPELRALLDGKGKHGLWLGYHDHSWVTLEELLSYDLDQLVILRGMVSPEEMARCRRTGEPPRGAVAWHRDPSWERWEWQEPLRDRASLVVRLIDALRPLGEPHYVRAVFGFDS
jgi:hypothetical protein